MKSWQLLFYTFQNNNNSKKCLLTVFVDYYFFNADIRAKSRLLVYSEPLPTKQVRHNDLTRRAVFSAKIVCHLSGDSTKAIICYTSEHYAFL